MDMEPKEHHVSRLGDFVGFFDSAGRFQKDDGTVDVVFLTNQGVKMPGRLVFKGGLCVSAEMADATSWAYPDGSPLDGVRMVLNFEGDEPLTIFIVRGRIRSRGDTPDGSELPRFDEFVGPRKVVVNQRAVTAIESLSANDRQAIRAILQTLTEQDVSKLSQGVAGPLGKDRQIYLLQATPELRAFVRVLNKDTVELFDIVREKTLQQFIEQTRIKGAST